MGRWGSGQRLGAEPRSGCAARDCQAGGCRSPRVRPTALEVGGPSASPTGGKHPAAIGHANHGGGSGAPVGAEYKTDGHRVVPLLYRRTLPSPSLPDTTRAGTPTLRPPPAPIRVQEPPPAFSPALPHLSAPHLQSTGLSMAEQWKGPLHHVSSAFESVFSNANDAKARAKAAAEAAEAAQATATRGASYTTGSKTGTMPTGRSTSSSANQSSSKVSGGLTNTSNGGSHTKTTTSTYSYKSGGGGGTSDGASAGTTTMGADQSGTLVALNAGSTGSLMGSRMTSHSRSSSASSTRRHSGTYKSPSSILRSDDDYDAAVAKHTQEIYAKLGSSVEAARLRAAAMAAETAAMPRSSSHTSEIYTMGNSGAMSAGDGSFTQTVARRRTSMSRAEGPTSELEAIEMLANEGNLSTFRLVELLKAKIAHLNEEYEVVTSENESLTASNEGLSQHLETAEETSMELEVTRKTMEESTRQLEEVREQMASNEARITALTVAKQEMQISLSAVHEGDDVKIEELTTKTSTLEKELQTSRTQLNARTTYCKELETKNEKLLRKRQTIQERYDVLMAESTQVTENNTLLKEEVTQETDKKTVLQAQLSEHVAKLEAIYQERTTLQEELEAITNDSEQLKGVNQTLVEEKTKLEQVTEEMETTVSSKTATLAENESTLHEMQALVSDRRLELEDFKTRIVNTEYEKDSLVEKLAAEQAEFKDVMEEITTKLTIATSSQQTSLEKERAKAAGLAAALGKDLALSKDTASIDAAVVAVKARIAESAMAQVAALAEQRSRAESMLRTLEQQIKAVRAGATTSWAASEVQLQVACVADARSRALKAEYMRACELVKQLDAQISASHSTSSVVSVVTSRHRLVHFSSSSSSMSAASS
ncbi:hypothetical protein BU14_0400s0009 [Porphyra umbilicalis]|uniref:Uncharacterized protein n=1 Tax=Porphyra umbilicalis TaxID=2786 RepID=A0A1X6NWF1_PORUM|nr:hypothetical protein BU14_0400s0009 [Porphyra umbilicalis]|eukprot:OSX72850.1 hypothetical protein BU14_0400s0009 [Porphyra umbilicalis]